MHPLLATTTTAEYALRAAVALQRREHRPGAGLSINLDGGIGSLDAVLDWNKVDNEEARQLDNHQVTEDAAEAVALAFVSVSRGWIVRRRLQRGEFADWLLRDADGLPVALEVSGVDGPRDAKRTREKVRQVCKVDFASIRSACVVAFGPPAVDLRVLSGPWT